MCVSIGCRNKMMGVRTITWLVADKQGNCKNHPIFLYVNFVRHSWKNIDVGATIAKDFFFVLAQQLEQVNHTVGLYVIVYISWGRLVTLSVSLLYCADVCSCLVIYSPGFDKTIRGWQISGRLSSALCVCTAYTMYLSWLHGSIVLKSVWVYLLVIYFHSISVTNCVLLIPRQIICTSLSELV